MYIKRCDGKRPCSVTARISIPEARTEGVVVGLRSERRTCRENVGIEARLVGKRLTCYAEVLVESEGILNIPQKRSMDF